MNDADRSHPDQAAPRLGRGRPRASARIGRAACAAARPPTPTTSPNCRAPCMPRWACRSKAHARIAAIDLDAVRGAPGVVAVLTAEDIPGVNDCGPIIHDDPILADGLVQYVGQPMFIVVADSHDNARRAARAGASRLRRTAGDPDAASGARCAVVRAAADAPAARRRRRRRWRPRRMRRAAR